MFFHKLSKSAVSFCVGFGTVLFIEYQSELGKCFIILLKIVFRINLIINYLLGPTEFEFRRFRWYPSICNHMSKQNNQLVNMYVLYLKL